MGAPVSLKPATKASFVDKKTLKIYVFRLLFQSTNGAVQPKKKVYLIKLEWLYLD